MADGAEIDDAEPLGQIVAGMRQSLFMNHGTSPSIGAATASAAALGSVARASRANRALAESMPGCSRVR